MKNKVSKCIFILLISFFGIFFTMTLASDKINEGNEIFVENKLYKNVINEYSDSDVEYYPLQEEENNGDKELENHQLRIRIYEVVILTTALGALGYIGFLIWKYKFSLGIYIHASSLELQTPIFNITNGKKKSEFWDGIEHEMKLYVSGEEINARFYKERDDNGKETGIMKVALINVSDDGRMMYYIIAGIKHNGFQVSWDHGKTLHRVNSVNRKSVEKQLKERKVELDNGMEAAPIFMFDYNEITSTTIRYTAIIPKGHKFNAIIDDLTKRDFYFFHQVDDKLYEIKTKFILKKGLAYSWDLIGLEPSTAYMNIHWSFDGKNIIMSSANYGVTRDENGVKVNLKDAKFPQVDVTKGLDLPSIASTVVYLGKDKALFHYKTSANKHLQRDTGYWFDSKLLAQKSKEYIYDWVEDAHLLYYELDDRDELKQDDKAIIKVMNGGKQHEETFDKRLFNMVDGQITDIDKEKENKKATN